MAISKTLRNKIIVTLVSVIGSTLVAIATRQVRKRLAKR